MEQEPDIAILIKESVLNHALAASFYTNQGSGLAMLLSRSLELDGPNRWMRLLDPPMVVTLGDGSVLVTFGGEVGAKVLGTRLEADVAATARIKVCTSGGTAYLEVQDIDLDLVSVGGWLRAPRRIVDVLDGVARGFLIAPGGEQGAREMPLPAVTLPPMGRGRSRELYITSLAVHQGAVGLGISAARADSVPPPPSDHEADILLRLTEPFLEQMIMESWEGVPHSVDVKKKIEVPDSRSLLDVVKGAVDVLLARGFKRDQVRIDHSWVEADAQLKYGQPCLRLLEGGRVEITECPLHVVARLIPRMEAAVWTPAGVWGRLRGWLLPDRRDSMEKEVLDLAEVTKDMDLRISKATANLSVDPDGILTVKIEDIDLDMPLEWGLPSDVVEKISTWIMEQTAERFPPVKVRLPIDTIMIPVLGVAPQISLRKLNGDQGHLDIHADLVFAEVPGPISPLPRFVADGTRRIVHRVDCPTAHLVPEIAKIGYFSLYDAISDGYRGCRECLTLYQDVGAAEAVGPGEAVRHVLGS